MADTLQYTVREVENGWHWELRAPDDRLISSGHATDSVQARAAAMLRGVDAMGDVKSPPGNTPER